MKIPDCLADFLTDLEGDDNAEMHDFLAVLNPSRSHSIVVAMHDALPELEAEEEEEEEE